MGEGRVPENFDNEIPELSLNCKIDQFLSIHAFSERASSIFGAQPQSVQEAVVTALGDESLEGEAKNALFLRRVRLELREAAKAAEGHASASREVPTPAVTMAAPAPPTPSRQAALTPSTPSRPAGSRSAAPRLTPGPRWETLADSDSDASSDKLPSLPQMPELSGPLVVQDLFEDDDAHFGKWTSVSSKRYPLKKEQQSNDSPVVAKVVARPPVNLRFAEGSKYFYSREAFESMVEQASEWLDGAELVAGSALSEWLDENYPLSD